MSTNAPENANRPAVDESDHEVDCIVIYGDATVGLRRFQERLALTSYRQLLPQPLASLVVQSDPSFASTPFREFRFSCRAFDGRPILCEDPFTTDTFAIDMTVVIAAGRAALDGAKQQSISMMARHVDARSGFDITERFQELEHPDDARRPFKRFVLLRHERIIAHLKVRVLPDTVTIDALSPADWKKATPLEQKLFLRRIDRGGWTRTPTCSTCGFPGVGYCRACDAHGVQTWVAP